MAIIADESGVITGDESGAAVADEAGGVLAPVGGSDVDDILLKTILTKGTRAMKWKKVEVEVANNGTYSAGFVIEPWALFFGALFPAMDNGDIGLEITLDGANYNPILDISDGADAVLVTSGSDPGWVDFSTLVRSAFDNAECMLRFTCASQTSGAVTITVYMRG